MECVTEDVIFVHMDKFQKLKQVINFFACPFTWISLEITHGKLKKQTKILLIVHRTHRQQIYFGKTSLVVSVHLC